MANIDGNNREWRMKKYLDIFGQIFGLNVIFVITCLPVITIGASLTALYGMCIRIQEGEEETILHGYIECFKKNFKQATEAFLAMVVIIVVLIAEYLLIITSDGVISMVYTFVVVLEAIAALFTFPFVFPLLSRYNNTVVGTFKNSALLAVAYIPSWMKFVTAWIAPIALSMIYPMIFLYTWYLWLLIFFGLIAWGTTHTIRAVFRGNEKASEEASAEVKKKE